MAIDPHNKINKDDDDQTGGSGSSIQFKSFIGENSNRDDMLPPEELRRLIVVHDDLHRTYVKKQKELLAHRQAVKDGKISVAEYRQGLEGNQNGAFKTNPRLNKAQFSGIDNKVNPLPTENVAETNQEKKQELVYRNELKNRLDQTPRFNPKPQFNR